MKLQVLVGKNLYADYAVGHFPVIQESRRHVSKFREDVVWLQNRTSPGHAGQLDPVAVSLGVLILPVSVLIEKSSPVRLGALS